MNKADIILQSYLPIILGVALLIFNRLIAESYERIARRDGTAFPRLITTTKLFIVGVGLVAFGLFKLIDIIS